MNAEREFAPRTYQPLPFTWNEAAGTMTVNPHYARIARRQFADGEVYLLDQASSSTSKEEAAFHAQLRDVFQSLPPAWEKKFPSPNHMRKWLLVRAGYCTETDYVFDSPKDARIASVLARKMDEYAIIKVVGNAMKIFSPRSQKRGQAPAVEARQVRRDVLELAATLFGWERKDIERNAGRSA